MKKSFQWGTLALALLAVISTMLVGVAMHTHAAAVTNLNCTLIVPANPLTAQGLATPYQFTATNAADGPCNETNPTQAAFVQAAVYNPQQNTISVYNPLVINAGTQPAVAPIVPTLPRGAIVGIWFGYNGNNLTLQGATRHALAQGRCVNGLGRSIFGQFAYCNAPLFFAFANRVPAPALGASPVDGMICPTVRDFSVVDQDQSDNVTSTYLVTANGQLAQNNAANAALGVATLKNASDNGLLTTLDGVIGCVPFMAPDLANPGHMTTALPLDELSAAQHQAAPVALVPNNDPMVLVNGNPNIFKRDLYRIGADQSPFASGNTKNYCQNMLTVAPSRIFKDRAATMAAASPAPAVGNSLFTFIASRFETAFGPNGLNCTGLLGVQQPIIVTRDGNGVAIDAQLR